MITFNNIVERFEDLRDESLLYQDLLFRVS